MTKETFSALGGDNWLSLDHQIRLSNLQTEIDEGGEPEQRAVRLKAAQAEIAALIAEPCERLVKSAIEYGEGAICAEVLGSPSTAEDKALLDAGREVFRIKNSGKLFEPLAVADGSIFLSQ